VKESVQDNNSIKLVNALKAINSMDGKAKRIRSMEIESNSCLDSQKSMKDDKSDDYESSHDSSAKPDLIRNKNCNTLPNVSLLHARNYSV
jgi:hypothetical protein